jgi:tetratricopeptide (TPR) repeat protein
LESIAQPEEQAQAGAYLVRVLRELPLDTPSDTSNRAFGWIAALLEAHMDTALAAPTRGRILSQVGETYASAGRWEDARRVLEAALPLLDGGEQAHAQLYLSKAKAGLGDTEEALRFARDAATAAPNRVAADWNLAQRLADAGLRAEALFAYRVLLTSSSIPADVRERIQAEVDTLGTDQAEGSL